MATIIIDVIGAIMLIAVVSIECGDAVGEIIVVVESVDGVDAADVVVFVDVGAHCVGTTHRY